MPRKVELDRGEMVRILRAARDGKLHLNFETYRWRIEGDRRPHARTRVLLVKRGHIDNLNECITQRGLRELARLELAE